MSEPLQVPFIKAGSIIPMSLTLGQVNGLYTVLDCLTEGFTKESSEALRVKVENKQPLSKREMALVHLSGFVQAIHKSAQDNGMMEYKSMEDTIQSMVSGTSS